MDLTHLLHTTFGHTHFRANQEAVCRAATDGRDCLLVMPTGAGKSLCYQLPAIARGGTALVVSPLIALMDDQAQKLTAAGLKVARIHSGLSRDDARQACRDYLDGRLQFLFIAPERLRVPGFPEMLARRKPSLIAIDEAHCISAWGHDFRPDYRTLGDFLPALRPAPILALTATATPTVQKDIVTQLALQQPALFIHGFRRDNLHIEVVELSKPRRTEFTSTFLKEKTRRPAIVYAPSRALAEELATALNHALGKRTAAPYHAGLPAQIREQVQRDFQSGSLEVVVATIAFGMGIDKADVRTVIHAALPASVEAYYQEIGRAGRDGKPSRTVLLYSYADRKMHDFFMERDYPVVSDLVRVSKALNDDFQMPDILRQQIKMDADTFARAAEKLAAQGVAQVDMAGNVRLSGTGSNSQTWQSGYAQQVEFRRSQIDRMMAFAETQQCRMTALIRHFGDTADGHRPCGHCDFCAPTSTTAQSFVEPSEAQEKNLRTILRALESRSTSTGKLHTELALTSDRKVFDALLDGLARAGLITLISEQWTNPEGTVVTFKKAAITHEGRELSNTAPLGVLLHPAAESPAGGKKRKRASQVAMASSSTLGVPATPLTPTQITLEAALRAYRKEEAAKTGKPAFIVFGDAALAALVQSAPRTLPELLTVSGFGPDKAERYGAAITAIIRNEHAAPAPPAKERPSSSRTKPERSADAVERGPNFNQSAASLRDTLTPTFHRDRPTPADPATTLTEIQQALEVRLRNWRKSESERMGLPQFFVLGTSTLRSIVLQHPRTLPQLSSIAGINPEKLDKFGPSILALLNA